MLGSITHRTGRAMVLRSVLRVAGAQLRVAEQVHRPQDPVAEKQCDNEHQG